MDPEDVEPFPTGLMMIGGDATSTEPQDTDVVGWACTVEGRPHAEPPACRGGVLLQVVFPDCWDGEHLDSADHRTHVARSTATGCPAIAPRGHAAAGVPRELPAARRTCRTSDLASGSLLTGHADFVNAWQPDKLAEEVRYCIHQDAYC